MIVGDNTNKGEVPAENPPKIPGARIVQHNKSGTAVFLFTAKIEIFQYLRGFQPLPERVFYAFPEEP